MPLALARRARRAGINLEIRACDVSPVAMGAARASAEGVGVPIEFFQADALGDDPFPEADVVVSTLFLHHLTEDQAVRLLSKMRAASLKESTSSSPAAR